MKGTFKILLRTLARNKLFSTINVIGLSAGLTVALLIYMLVYNERSFDHSFPDHERIYRVNTVWQDHRLGQKSAMSPVGLGAIIEESVPGVENVLRVWGRFHVAKTETYARDMQVNWAEADLFQFFPTPLLYGSFDEALSVPGGAAISRTQALAMFGEEDVIGKTFFYGTWEWDVRAVFEDYPVNTSVGYPIYTGFATIGNYYNDPRAQNRFEVDTWLMLDAGTDPEQVAERLNEIAADTFAQQNCLFELMPLTKFHFNSVGYEHLGYGKADLTQVRLFSILAVVILLIVCVNYMNLSTAQAQKRLRVIGLNKILGAQRSTIVWRSYLESTLLTLIAFVIAFGLVYLLLPEFSNIMGVQLPFDNMVRDPWVWSGVVAIFLFVVLVSASYSAFYLSGFPPTMAVKKGGSTYKVLRQVLSVGQFAVAMILITWVLVIETQTSYIYSKDLGYNPEELIGFYVRTAKSESEYATLEEELRRIGSVQETSRISAFPTLPGINLFKDRSSEAATIQMQYLSGDEHTTDLFQMEMVAGRPLPEPFVPLRSGSADTLLTAMLNERAVAALDMTPEEIVGQRIYIGNKERPTPLVVGGVVKDFNLQSLYHPITPCAFINLPGGRYYQLVRFAGGDRAENVEACREVFERLFPNDTFGAHYIDDELQANYSGVRQTERVIIMFTLLAIIMACMGVFALTVFLVEQRTKEIGIRRVLGASVGRILALFSITYLRLLAIAVVIAIPVSVLVCNNYLQAFAFRISISWWMFAVAAGITLLLVLIAVIVPAFKAAVANPVKALMTE